MSVLTDHVDALRARRARYEQSLINLDAKLAAEASKPVIEAPVDEDGEPTGPNSFEMVQTYVEQEKAKITAAIVSIDDDLVLLK